MGKIKDDEYYMQLAIAEAQKAAGKGEVPIGAVIVCNGEVIAAAHNLCIETNDATAHAELLAIKQASKKLGAWRLSTCTMYVTLEPCAMCVGAALNSRLNALVFGAFEKNTGCCGSVVDLAHKTFLHSIETIGGVLEEECAAILSNFFRQKR